MRMNVNIVAACNELWTAAKKAIKKASHFDVPLDHLLKTMLMLLKPKVDEMMKLNGELKFSKTKMELLTCLRDGKVLVDKCTAISKYRPINGYNHSKKLMELHDSLLSFFQVKYPTDFKFALRRVVVSTSENPFVVPIIVPVVAEKRECVLDAISPKEIVDTHTPPAMTLEARVSAEQGDGPLGPISAPLNLCRRFTFVEIQSATQNFNDAFIIGKGGFGKVYKGFFDNRANAVAIKRLDPVSNQGDTEFRTEIEMLSNFRHCNLVSLIGYCYDGREMIIVYEYMLNGSMADHLHPKDGRNGNNSNLSWVQRLKICIGAARGIDYLHTGTGVSQSVIHRDIKTSNILLDENWAAKVSDFGLCKIGPANQSCTHISTRVKGTPGYWDPEYCLTHRLTRKSDVYSFGVVLLEALSGKPALLDLRLPKEQRSLVAWAQHFIQENIPHKLIDPNLEWEIRPSSLEAFVGIAAQCLQIDRKKRPKMADVVLSLELALAMQTSKDSSLLNEDIFDFVETPDINDHSLQVIR
ncbi:hypothetical protein LguiB_023846 [Lonicera macranthoides]